MYCMMGGPNYCSNNNGFDLLKRMDIPHWFANRYIVIRVLCFLVSFPIVAGLYGIESLYYGRTIGMVAAAILGTIVSARKYSSVKQI